MAAVENLSALAQSHEAVARTPRAVACRAEGRNVIVFHQPADHLIQGALIRDIELFRVVRAFFFCVSAHGGPGRSADLGDAEAEQPAADSLAFSCGDDHAGIGYGERMQAVISLNIKPIIIANIKIAGSNFSIKFI